jgi:hypothetical protein
MRHFAGYVFFAALAVISCNSVPELTEKDAEKKLVKEFKYPRTIDYEIFCSDPAHAKKVLSAGLEEDGLVEVRRTQKLKDVGKPLVQFTNKANPYLLSVNEKEKGLDLQRVKIAEEVIADIVITKNVNATNTLLVEFTTYYKDITPFARLLGRSTNEKRRHEVLFTLRDKKWVLERNNR